MATRIQLRRGTASEWTSANPILAEGEFGYETDTTKFKIGSGTASWSALEYASAGLDPATASATYLSISAASATYLTITDALDTYLPISASATLGGGEGDFTSFLLMGA